MSQNEQLSPELRNVWNEGFFWGCVTAGGGAFVLCTLLVAYVLAPGLACS